MSLVASHPPLKSYGGFGNISSLARDKDIGLAFNADTLLFYRNVERNNNVLPPHGKTYEFHEGF